jgi:hypothetical protein
MPFVPGVANCIFAKEKIVKYLLSEIHPQGNSKFKFFTKFGFLSNKKKAEFRIFNQALHFMEVEEIKDYETLEKILMYRKQLGEYRTERTQYTDEAIRATFRELRIDRIEA